MGKIQYKFIISNFHWTLNTLILLPSFQLSLSFPFIIFQIITISLSPLNLLQGSLQITSSVDDYKKPRSSRSYSTFHLNTNHMHTQQYVLSSRMKYLSPAQGSPAPTPTPLNLTPCSPPSISLLKFSKSPLLLSSLLFMSCISSIFTKQNTTNIQKNPSHQQVHIHQFFLLSFLSKFLQPQYILTVSFHLPFTPHSLFSGSAF